MMASHIVILLAVVDSSTFIVIGVGVASILFVRALSIRHKRAIKARHHQLLHRLSNSDQLFTEGCGVTLADQPTVIAIRNVIAEACKLPPEKIYSDDRLADLFPMMSFAFLDDGWDTTGFLFGLMEILGPIIRLQDEKLYDLVSTVSINAARGSDRRVGEFAGKIANHLRRSALR